MFASVAISYTKEIHLIILKFNFTQVPWTQMTAVTLLAKHYINDLLPSSWPIVCVSLGTLITQPFTVHLVFDILLVQGLTILLIKLCFQHSKLFLSQSLKLVHILGHKTTTNGVIVRFIIAVTPLLNTKFCLSSRE